MLRIKIFKYLLEWAQASLLKRTIARNTYRGELDYGAFLSDCGYHMAYGNLPKNLMEDEESEFDAGLDISVLISDLKKNGYRHAVIVAEYLKYVERMEREDKERQL
jgi:hypothetical protein